MESSERTSGSQKQKKCGFSVVKKKGSETETTKTQPLAISFPPLVTQIEKL